MRDLVYIFGTGSKCKDKELLFSMRSVVKHVRNCRKIVVAGAWPRFIVNGRIEVPFTHLPIDDLHCDKAQNIRNKLLAACKSEEVTEEFILMNDDFFFIKDVDADTLPHYRQGTLPEHLEWRLAHSSTYRQALEKTERALREKGLPVRDFELHVPFPYDKRNLSRVLTTEFDWSEKRGCLMRSLYANFRRLEGSLLSDCKIDTPHPRAEILRRLQGRSFFSVGDGGLNADMWALLEEWFPGAR